MASSVGSSELRTLRGWRLDCAHLAARQPCRPHKQTGVRCADCAHYRRAERLANHCEPRRQPAAGSEVLLVKRGAMGDVLRTTALLPELERLHPRLTLTWVVDPASVPLLSNNPRVDRILESNRPDLPAVLGDTVFKWALNLDVDAESGVILQQARAERFSGYGVNHWGVPVPLEETALDWLEMSLDDEVKRANQCTYQDHLFRLLGLEFRGEAPQLVLDDEALQRQSRLEAAQGHTPVVALHTGAGTRWEFKKWTRQGFIDLIGWLRARRPEIGFRLLGGRHEADRNAAIKEAAGGERVELLDTRERVLDLAAAVAASQVLVCGDTLPMHMATAFGVPAVVLFGPTSAPEIHLYGRGDRIVADVPCVGCYLPRCDREPYCQETITPDEVGRAVLRWLGA